MKKTTRSQVYPEPPPKPPKTQVLTAVTMPGKMLTAKLIKPVGAAVLLLASLVHATTSVITAPMGAQPANVPATCAALQALGHGNLACPPYGLPTPTGGDVSAALTASVAQAIAQKSPILTVPPGLYVVKPKTTGDPMIPVYGSLTIRCAPGATFKLLDQSLTGGNKARIISNIDGTGTVHPVANVRIEGCTFDGNCRGNQPACGVIPGDGSPVTELVAFARAEGVHLEGNTFVDIPYQAFSAYTGTDIHFDHNAIFSIGQTVNSDAVQFNGVQNGTMIGNTVLNAGEGLVVQNSTATVAKEGNGAVATLARGITIANNVIDTLGANEICQGPGVPFACCTGEKAGTSANVCAAGVSGGGSIIFVGQKGAITGNVVNRSNTINIESGRGFETNDVTVSGNTMTSGIANCMAAFVITGGSEFQIHNINFVGNTCESPAASGVFIGAGATTSAFDISIASNDIRAPTFTGVLLKYQTASGSGIIRDVTIRDNEINDACGGFGAGTCGSLFMQDNTSPAFQNITLKGNRLKGSSRYFIWLQGTQTEFRVEDNNFISPTSGVANLGANSGVRIEHWINNRVVFASSPFTLASPTNTVGQYVAADAITFATLTAANGLNTATNGSLAYCSDCDPATSPCTSVGTKTGAFAKRLNGAWNCTS